MNDNFRKSKLTIYFSAMEDEDEDMPTIIEPKWKFDKITTITLDEPIAT